MRYILINLNIYQEIVRDNFDKEAREHEWEILSILVLVLLLFHI
jgi:hypothetical protein